MAVMKLYQLDPICPSCIKDTKVELFAGTPCTIKVTVKLAPPPTGTTFPAATENVTYAELKYSDDDGNTATQELAPDYEGWTSGTTHVIQFSAASWLTSNEFPNTTAHVQVVTDKPRNVFKWFAGIEG
jgi:hypothetical protein